MTDLLTWIIAKLYTYIELFIFYIFELLILNIKESWQIQTL